MDSTTYFRILDIASSILMLGVTIYIIRTVNNRRTAPLREFREETKIQEEIKPSVICSNDLFRIIDPAEIENEPYYTPDTPVRPLPTPAPHHRAHTSRKAKLPQPKPVASFMIPRKPLPATAHPLVTNRVTPNLKPCKNLRTRLDKINAGGNQLKKQLDRAGDALKKLRKPVKICGCLKSEHCEKAGYGERADGTATGYTGADEEIAPEYYPSEAEAAYGIEKQEEHDENYDFEQPEYQLECIEYGDYTRLHHNNNMVGNENFGEMEDDRAQEQYWVTESWSEHHYYLDNKHYGTISWTDERLGNGSSYM